MRERERERENERERERERSISSSIDAFRSMRLLYAQVILFLTTRISDVSLDCGVNRTTEAGTASAVEGCICPTGYKVSHGGDFVILIIFKTFLI